ncbi:MAG TPA: chemotaxis protein CheW [Lachnospiraceae bacterium]|nr:chemotaxis protein CheW [Lachnospiraceae bacterium]
MISDQYVLFLLNSDIFALPFSSIQEIARLPEEITCLPRMPSHIDGVINLRGNVISVINLKRLFDMPDIDKRTIRQLLLIDQKGTLMGLVVDDVIDILTIGSLQINNKIAESYSHTKNCLNGTAVVDNRIVLLLNITRLKTEILQLKEDMEERYDSFIGFKCL